MDRRDFLARAGSGVAGLALLSGCSSGDGGTETETGGAGGTESADGTETTSGAESASETESGGGETTSNASTTDEAGDSTTVATTTSDLEGTLTVATYSSFTGEDTAGAWLKSAFEKRHPKTTVEFTVPESGLNQYIQRRNQGAPIDADVYVGLNTGELVRADETLDGSLFASADGIEGTGSIKSALDIDPKGRAVTYDTGYITPVYNANEIDAPKSFDSLLESAYENALITENAQQSDPGRAFVLWTILEKGVDGYLDYWQSLSENGLRVLSDWQPAYDAFTNGEAPMVVSYSTDQVYYHESDAQLEKHRIAFLDGEGYANPEAMARFDGSDSTELATQFMSFMLSDSAQGEIATRNVQFPAVKGVDPGGSFSKYAKEPETPVTMGYEKLTGNVDEWIDQWARQVRTSG